MAATRIPPPHQARMPRRLKSSSFRVGSIPSIWLAAYMEGVRRGLSDWLDWMGLIDAGPRARLDRFVGYYQSYAESHEELDRDIAL